MKKIEPKDDLFGRVELIVRTQLPLALPLLSGINKGSVREKIVKLYKVSDDVANLSKGKIDCKQGCTYCCHYHVMVTAPEVFALVEEIGRMPADRQAEVVGKIAENAERAAKMTQSEYIRTNIACAFLKDGGCSVYAMRPLACRGHHSGDVGVCQRTFDSPMSPEEAPRDFDRYTAAIAFDNVMLASQYHLKLDGTKYEMHAALNEAITNPASSKRWREGKSAFPGVKDKVTLEEMFGPEQ